MATYLPFGLSRVLNAMNMRLLDALRPVDLTITQFRVMQCLKEVDRGLGIGEIGREVVLEQSTVSRVIDQLQKKAFVQRARSRTNPKVVEVTLTDRGQTQLAELLPKAHAIVDDTTSVLTVDEAERLDELLGKLYVHLRPSG